jgi:hypothetical protein
MERRPDGRLFCAYAQVLEIVWCEAGMPCNTSKHPRSDFFAIMKCEDEIRVALPAQDAM